MLLSSLFGTFVHNVLGNALCTAKHIYQSVTRGSARMLAKPSYGWGQDATQGLRCGKNPVHELPIIIQFFKFFVKLKFFQARNYLLRK